MFSLRLIWYKWFKFEIRLTLDWNSNLKTSFLLVSFFCLELFLFLLLFLLLYIQSHKMKYFFSFPSLCLLSPTTNGREEKARNEDEILFHVWKLSRFKDFHFLIFIFYLFSIATVFLTTMKGIWHGVDWAVKRERLKLLIFHLSSSFYSFALLLYAYLCLPALSIFKWWVKFMIKEKKTEKKCFQYDE